MSKLEKQVCSVLMRALLGWCWLAALGISASSHALEVVEARIALGPSSRKLLLKGPLAPSWDQKLIDKVATAHKEKVHQEALKKHSSHSNAGKRQWAKFHMLHPDKRQERIKKMQDSLHESEGGTHRRKSRRGGFAHHMQKSPEQIANWERRHRRHQINLAKAKYGGGSGRTSSAPRRGAGARGSSSRLGSSSRRAGSSSRRLGGSRGGSSSSGGFTAPGGHDEEI